MKYLLSFVVSFLPTWLFFWQNIRLFLRHRRWVICEEGSFGHQIALATAICSKKGLNILYVKRNINRTNDTLFEFICSNANVCTYNHLFLRNKRIRCSSAILLKFFLNRCRVTVTNFYELCHVISAEMGYEGYATYDQNKNVRKHLNVGFLYSRDNQKIFIDSLNRWFDYKFKHEIDLLKNTVSSKFIYVVHRQKKDAVDYLDKIRNLDLSDILKRESCQILSQFAVVHGGEASTQEFRFHPQTLASTLKIPVSVVDLFLFLKCSGYIGAQSGPVWLVGQREIPVLVLNALPFFHGGFGEKHIVCYQKLVDDKGEKIDFQHVIASDLLITEYFDLVKGLSVHPMSETEVSEVVAEFSSLVCCGSLVKKQSFESKGLNYAFDCPAAWASFIVNY